MLKLIRSNRRTLMGILVVSTITLAMSGFGVKLFNGTKDRESYAVKINDIIIDERQFTERKRHVLDLYRQMYGKNYGLIAESIEKGLNQRLADDLISETLLKEEAKKNNLYVGRSAVRNALLNNVFRGNYNDAEYESYLRQMGMTSVEFENQIESDLLAEQLTTLYQHASIASKLEAKKAIEIDETEYAVSSVELNPENFIKDIKEPSDSDIESYYTDNASSYEKPRSVAYDYVVMDPINFLNLVEISPQDIEFYYTDNQAKFMRPEEVEVSHIKLLYPKDSDPKKMADVKAKAEEVYAKATAGEPFENLASIYSDDIATRVTNGYLGWVQKGKMPKEFDDAVFKAKSGEIASLINTSYGYHIVKVMGRKESEVKPLIEVKADIEKELKKQDAPAYTSNKAADLFDAWQKSKETLEDVAKKNNLTFSKSSSSLAEEQDPSPALKSLTSRVIVMPEEKKQIIDLGEKSVLVSVNQYTEAAIPPIAEIKQKIIADIKKRESFKAARNRAEEIIKRTSETASADLTSVSKNFNLSAQETAGISKQKEKAGIFSSSEVQQAVFSTFKPMEKPSKVFENSGKFYVIQVKSLKKPSDDVINSKLETYKDSESGEIAKILTASTVNRLKAKSEIDINQVLLVE